MCYKDDANEVRSHEIYKNKLFNKEGCSPNLCVFNKHDAHNIFHGGTTDIQAFDFLTFTDSILRCGNVKRKKIRFYKK